MSEKYLSIMSLRAPHLLRYVSVAALLYKKTISVKDLVHVLAQANFRPAGGRAEEEVAGEEPAQFVWLCLHGQICLNHVARLDEVLEWSPVGTIPFAAPVGLR